MKGCNAVAVTAPSAALRGFAWVASGGNRKATKSVCWPPDRYWAPSSCSRHCNNDRNREDGIDPPAKTSIAYGDSVEVLQRDC